jgi:hypothetical protein
MWLVENICPSHDLLIFIIFSMYSFAIKFHKTSYKTFVTPKIWLALYSNKYAYKKMHAKKVFVGLKRKNKQAILLNINWIENQKWNWKKDARHPTKCWKIKMAFRAQSKIYVLILYILLIHIEQSNFFDWFYIFKKDNKFYIFKNIVLDLYCTI